jgi:queuine tRNA-ribosyltransferase
VLELAHGKLPLPAFLPDATRGFVRAVDAGDLEACGVEALMMNTFHLMQRPGSSTVAALGGLHALSGWARPIFTDSGGFQAWSVLRQDPRAGRVDDEGFTWRRPSGRRFRLSPEKSVQLQLRYGADVVICLDDCTHPDDPEERQVLAVERTVAWAARSKRCFEAWQGRRDAGPTRPLLFAVVQGGVSRELRARCTEALLELGFDGLGFGGWPLDRQGRLLVEPLARLREAVPAALPLHALGVGHPESVAACAALGYGLFDSALPTRDARRGRLFAFRADPAQLDPAAGPGWLETCYVGDARHTKARDPLSPWCDAPCCRRYALGYLHHLHAQDDPLFARLATLHNLRFVVRLVEALRARPA